MKLRILVVISLLFVASAALAGTITFTPGSAGVGSAINSDGFFVSHDTTGLFGADAWTSDFQLNTYATPYGAGGAPSPYSDAGLVLFLDGGLTLGQLQGVSVDSTGSELAVNLWLDTGGDGKFFSFDTTGLMTSVNGDSYAGCGVPAIGAASSCFMLGGLGIGGSFTLADLQGGVVPGIDGNTNLALWIGITNGGGQALSTDIKSITVTTGTPVPEPASILLLGTGLFGLAGTIRRRKL